MTSNVKNLKDLLAGAQLAALPQSAIRLLELAQNPDLGPSEFAVPIESDPGLASQVLKFVNSSYFGFAREISSVKLAISMVGIRTIKNFTLWSAVFSLMPNPKCGAFELRSLWQDSLRRGLFARAFGKTIGLKDAEDLFAAALLQDMAIPLLAKELAQQYTKLFAARAGGSARLSDLEQAEFGWNHAVAGGILARTWNLPESFAKMIESHTSLDTTLAAAPLDKAVVSVGLSAWLPSSVDPQWNEIGGFLSRFTKLAPAASPEALFEQVDKEYAEIAPILKLPPAKTTLVQSLSAATQPAGK